MKISIILLLLIIVALFENNLTFHFNNGLVYNGQIFKTEDYPYVMFLRFWTSPTTYNSCTGTLVRKMFVLTAAHCCFGRNESKVEVIQGSPLVKNLDIHKIVKMTSHPEYDPVKNPIAIRGDLCVIQLKTAFTHIKTYSKIGGSPKDFAKGKKLNCKMIGFGGTGNNKTDGKTGYMFNNDILHGEKACKLYDSPEITHTWKQYLCLVPNGPSTTCQGDSGGPMICNKMQYGVCSYGYPYTPLEGGCGVADQQEVYVFIHYYIKWVNDIIDSKKEKKNKKKKRSSGNLLKSHYTLNIILSTLLYNIMLIFI